MKLLLAVCIGNICRSPMAEGLLKKSLPDFQVISAGLGALVGQPADPNAQKIMVEDGIDISEHRAQQINSLLCKTADLILVMDQDQRRSIERQFPFARGKVFRIAESAKLDVPDPYTKSPEAFKAAFEIIDAGVNDWVQRINKIY